MPKTKELKIESEEVRLEQRQYTLVKEYHQRGYDTAFQNMRMYYGKNPELGLGQYDPVAARRLTAVGRHLVQQNFILPLVDSVAAAMMQQKFNAEFVPVSGKPTSMTDLPNKLIFSDKEMMNWDHHVFDHATKGLIHDSAIKIGLSDKWNRLGNITLTTAHMNSTFPDPRWKTLISSECEHVWHDAWLSPKKILDLCKEQHPEIMDAADKIEKDGMKFGVNAGVQAFHTTENIWGSLYRVIEHYYLEKKERKATCLIIPGQEDVEVPAEVKKDDIGAWLTRYFPDWQADQVYERDVTDKISKVVTICPTLYGKGFLQNEETELQVGATPWKFWSASRLEGDPRGFIESVKDSQTYVNYWAGLTTHKVQTEGGGGAQYSHAEMFKNNQEWQRWKKYRNNPQETFEILPQLIEKGINPAIPVTKSAYPAEVYKSIEFFVDKMLPRISKITPAFLGQAEGAGESGYLFRQKKVQSDLQTFTIMYGWKLFWNDVYESYLLQAGRQYSQEMLEREFPMAGTGGRERIKVNEVVDLGDGNYGIKNDMTMLRNIRHAVIIDDKPDTPTDQAERLVLYSETAEKFSKVPGKEASTGLMLNLVVQNLNLRQVDNALFERVGKLESDVIITKLEAQLVEAQNFKANQEQVAAGMATAAQGAEGGAQPPAEAGGGGQPPEQPPRRISRAGPAGPAEPPPPLQTKNAQESAGG